MNLVEQVRENAVKYPHKEAFYFEGNRTTYGELEKQVSRLAFSLHQLGMKKGDHVAVILNNSPDFIISFYAIMRVGATTIPINPAFTVDEMAYIIDNGDVEWIIFEGDLHQKINELKRPLKQMKGWIVCGDLEEENSFYSLSQLINHEHDFVPISLQDDDLAIILYTSGTTGYPKGAMLTHGNLVANARDVGNFFLFTCEDRVIATLPFYHVFALTVVLNVPLTKGATIFIAPRFSPMKIFELARLGASVFAGVPTMYSFLYQYEEGNPKDFSNLRLAISGGAPLPIKVLENFERRFQIPIFEGYGLSEASPVTCFNPPDRERKPGSIGMSILNVENKVVDENGQEVKVGEVGELICRGPNVMKGYYKMEKETANTIRDDWLYTGDLAKQDKEGYFYIVDRKKDLIIVGGLNVYPREVEEVLYTYPQVLEAAVIGVQEEDYGEEVHAYIVLKDERCTRDELEAFCKKYLAPYKIPKVYHFVQELPKNSTGKILKRFLKERNFEAK